MTIYLIFRCDRWKSTSSYQLVGTSTSFEKLKEQLRIMERNNIIEYAIDSLEELDEIFVTTVGELNDIYDYVYIKEVYDGMLDI